LEVFSRTEVSELRRGRRSRDLSDGSANMLSSPVGPLGFPDCRCLSSSACEGATRALGGTFSGLVLAPFGCVGGGGGGRLFGSAMAKFSYHKSGQK
jgi:hypothetical protein